MRSLCLTCTESPFLLCIHNTNKSGYKLIKEKKERKHPYWWQILILSGPLLEVSCLYAPCSPLTPAPAPRQKNIYLHTDDITMPTASVGHNSSLNICSQAACPFRIINNGVLVNWWYQNK
jgi:hypothetical protein